MLSHRPIILGQAFVSGSARWIDPQRGQGMMEEVTGKSG
jgi:hypothetical protein